MSLETHERALAPPINIDLTTETQARRLATPVRVDLTTEIRWFFDGQLPVEVDAWFASGGRGLDERRCDLYRLDGRLDCGVKLRGRALLEMKQRMRLPQFYRFSTDVEGHLEYWQRWSPADDLVAVSEQNVWVAVDKHIVKKRFDTTGSFVPASASTLAMTGAGCDAEVTTVAVDGQPGWSFALSAFGPLDGHIRALEGAWHTAIRGHAWPCHLKLERSTSCGYPEWISRVAGR